MYQITSFLSNLAHQSSWNVPPIFRNELNVFIVTILNVLSPIIFIVGSLLLYFSGLSSVVLWWLVIIIATSILCETLMVLLFYKQSVIFVTSIFSVLPAISLTLPFWLISQTSISWTYKMLIMVPSFFIYVKLILPYISALLTLLSVLIAILLSPLISVEKIIRGRGKEN